MYQTTFSDLFADVPFHLALALAGAVGYLLMKWTKIYIYPECTLSSSAKAKVCEVDDWIATPETAQKPRKVARTHRALRQRKKSAEAGAALEEGVMPPAELLGCSATPGQAVEDQQAAPAQDIEGQEASTSMSAADEASTESIVEEQPTTLDSQPAPVSDRVARLLAKKAERKARKAQEVFEMIASADVGTEAASQLPVMDSDMHIDTQPANSHVVVAAEDMHIATQPANSHVVVAAEDMHIDTQPANSHMVVAVEDMHIATQPANSHVVVAAEDMHIDTQPASSHVVVAAEDMHIATQPAKSHVVVAAEDEDCEPACTTTSSAFSSPQKKLWSDDDDYDPIIAELSTGDETFMRFSQAEETGDDSFDDEVRGGAQKYCDVCPNEEFGQQPYTQHCEQLVRSRAPFPCNDPWLAPFDDVIRSPEEARQVYEQVYQDLCCRAGEFFNPEKQYEPVLCDNSQQLYTDGQQLYMLTCVDVSEGVDMSAPQMVRPVVDVCDPLHAEFAKDFHDGLLQCVDPDAMQAALACNAPQQTWDACFEFLSS